MKKAKKILFLILCLVLVVFYWSLPDGKTRLIFCDVGQGDGVMLTRGTFQLLYDVGPKNGKMKKCIERQVPFWDRKIEVVIISHWDKDHSGGLEGINTSYKIDKLYSGSSDNEHNFSPEFLRAKDVLRSDWFSFEILSPEDNMVLEDDNEMSVVGVMRVGDKKILLTGDAPVAIEQKLVWRKILKERMDVLKVGHHGSDTGTSEELLDAVKPRVAIIGVGKNSYGHPSVIVLERLERWGVEVKRTDEDGNIVFKF
ncbi:MBL fold metallo-hydrolase [Patescibacteria group bacterium]|nr:MBL fold metallo-hydrolase [Patescibacteria group bacterium]